MCVCISMAFSAYKPVIYGYIVYSYNNSSWHDYNVLLPYTVRVVLS